MTGLTELRRLIQSAGFRATRSGDVVKVRLFQGHAVPLIDWLGNRGYVAEVVSTRPGNTWVIARLPWIS